MTLFFDKQAVGHVDDLLPLYGPMEFASPTRSTVPLFSLLKHGDGIWASIVRLVAGEGCSTDLHVEYTVAPTNGTGKPSHTDVMLRKGSFAVAVEAKWTEPRYHTVQEWLLGGANLENRRAVMTGWLSLLESRVGRVLQLHNFDNAVYQMVHRAASACAVSTSPAMAYLQFSPLPNNTLPNIAQLKKDILNLQDLLGNTTALPLYLLVVEVEASAEFLQISELPRGSASTATEVKAMLRKKSLFNFKRYSRVL